MLNLYIIYATTVAQAYWMLAVREQLQNRIIYT